MSSHDPLCPCPPIPEHRLIQVRAAGIKFDDCCCDLIARVREDERSWDGAIRIARAAAQEGYAAALRDAVEAVKACDDLQPSWWKSMFFGGRRARAWCQYGWDWHKRDAVAAIEALGGER